MTPAQVLELYAVPVGVYHIPHLRPWWKFWQSNSCGWVTVTTQGKNTVFKWESSPNDHDWLEGPTKTLLIYDGKIAEFVHRGWIVVYSRPGLFPRLQGYPQAVEFATWLYLKKEYLK